jgi:hypothetical protein
MAHFQNNWMQIHVLNLPKDGKDMFILCFNDIKRGMLKGNYCLPAENEHEANVKMVWGTTEKFSRCLFLETTKIIMEDEELKLFNKCKSILSSPSRVLNCPKKEVDSFFGVDRQEKITFLQEHWEQLFDIDTTHRLRVNPFQSTMSFGRSFQTIKQFVEKEDDGDEEALFNAIRYNILVDVYFDPDPESENYYNTKPSGFCFGIAPYQVHRAVKDFAHDQEHLPDFVDYMTDYLQINREYVMPLCKDSGYYETVDCRNQTVEANIQLAIEGKQSDFHWGGMNSFYLAGSHSFEKDFTNGKAVTTIAKEERGYVYTFGNSDSLKHRKLCLGQYRMKCDSRYGNFHGCVLDMCRVFLVDTNVVVFDGSHYYNIFRFNEGFDLLDELENAYQQMVGRFKSIIDKMKKDKENK